ncbi:MAG: flavodoxin-dependent (E)-4-hydroxy-3-methylbut-2-enyl-diphosphate synthase, partial [Bacteroidales bacterium]|nr:flavodoxin-dependent (E)-4-hydroxy-3-methylbut-2-enyl-diphosphate synthase [Bacteroidales bacterium]
RYGDTPLGMVESAMEFVRICEDFNYYDIVLSMKASNVKVMVQTNRLLVNKMMNEEMNYPIHLGVTEAGDSEDGRIKSAAGIGTLLEDGIGDTIRVSLTEEPEFEIPVAKIIISRYINKDLQHYNTESIFNKKFPANPFEYYRRKTNPVKNIGGNNVPIVICNINKDIQNKLLATDKFTKPESVADFIYIGKDKIFSIHPDLSFIRNYQFWNKDSKNIYPLFKIEDYFCTNNKSDKINFVSVKTLKRLSLYIEKIKKDKTVVLVIESGNNNGIYEQRKIFFELIDKNCNVPVIIKRNYKNTNTEEFLIYSSIDLSALLIDGFGDGIWIETDNKINLEFINQTAFGILQATGARITKTEYIACPSCGRTLFNIQETLKKIKSRTQHLKGLKIGIMGCIVNGPGEMADADYGYVGSGPGKITLYKGKQIIRRNIEEQNAVDALIELINT